MDYGIGALGGFNRFFEPDFAALVLRVSHDNNGFAAGFAVEFVAASEVDGVVESGARHVAADRAGIPGNVSAARRVDASFVDGAVENAAVVGKVSEKVDVGIEGDNHGLIALAQDSVKETGAGILDRAKHVLFAAGGVEQKSEGDGKSHFLGEEGDLFFVSVLGDLEVVLLEVGDNAFIFVADGGERFDEFASGFNGRALGGSLWPCAFGKAGSNKEKHRLQARVL